MANFLIVFAYPTRWKHTILERLVKSRTFLENLLNLIFIFALDLYICIYSKFKSYKIFLYRKNNIHGAETP